MMRWFRKRRRRPDVLGMFNEIAFPNTGVNYTEKERWADFKRVFLGTAQGRRVLSEIIGWAGLLESSAVPGDPHATYFNEGTRQTAVQILAVLRSDAPDDSPSTEADSDPFSHEPEQED